MSLDLRERRRSEVSNHRARNNSAVATRRLGSSSSAPRARCRAAHRCAARMAFSSYPWRRSHTARGTRSCLADAMSAAHFERRSRRLWDSEHVENVGFIPHPVYRCFNGTLGRNANATGFLGRGVENLFEHVEESNPQNPRNYALAHLPWNRRQVASAANLRRARGLMAKVADGRPPVPDPRSPWPCELIPSQLVRIERRAHCSHFCGHIGPIRGRFEAGEQAERRGGVVRNPRRGGRRRNERGRGRARFR